MSQPHDFYPVIMKALFNGWYKLHGRSSIKYHYFYKGETPLCNHSGEIYPKIPANVRPEQKCRNCIAILEKYNDLENFVSMEH